MEGASSVTSDDINQLCESFLTMADTMGSPRHKIHDLFFYGCYGPLPLVHNQIKVKKDGNACQSVIATQDIPERVVVTHFPVHAIGVDHRIQICEQEKGDEVFVERVARYAMTHSHYLPLRESDDTTNDTPICALIIGNPGNTRNPLLLGHVIQDAVGNPFSTVSFVDIKEWITFKNKVAMYYITGKSAFNCRYVTNTRHTLVSVETTRPIKEGEELRIMYGAEYWFHRTFDKKDEKNLGNYLFELLTEDTEFKEWLIKLHQ